jgi:hypothetical protein
VPRITRLSHLTGAIPHQVGHIETLDVQGPVSAFGAGGEVWDVAAVNGARPTSPLRVTLLEGEGGDGPPRAFTSLQALQQRLAERAGHGEAHAADGADAAAAASLPGLAGLPRFSFGGNMRGRTVWGFAAERLDAQGYVPFASVLRDGSPGAAAYEQELTLPDRLLLACDVAEAFVELGELSFVHGGLDAATLLVDLRGCTAALGSFAAGGVVGGPDGEHPARLHAAAETWLAHEARMQLAGGSEGTATVGFAADAWTLAVAVHHLLLRSDPFFMLKDREPETVREYVTRVGWPRYDVFDPLFAPGLEGRHAAFVNGLAALPPPVFRLLLQAMSAGVLDPGRRPAPREWAAALSGARQPVAIEHFGAAPGHTLQGRPVTLAWRVAGARWVAVEPGLGEVEAAGSRELHPAFSTTYTLTARPRRGEPVSRGAEVWVTPVPSIGTLLVPTPNLSHRVVIHTPSLWSAGLNVAAPSLAVGAPRIDLAAPDLPAAPAPALSVRIGGEVLRGAPRAPPVSDDLARPRPGEAVTGRLVPLGTLFTRLHERVKAELNAMWGGKR